MPSTLQDVDSPPAPHYGLQSIYTAPSVLHPPSSKVSSILAPMPAYSTPSGRPAAAQQPVHRSGTQHPCVHHAAIQTALQSRPPQIPMMASPPHPRSSTEQSTSAPSMDGSMPSMPSAVPTPPAHRAGTPRPLKTRSPLHLLLPPIPSSLAQTMAHSMPLMPRDAPMLHAHPSGPQFQLPSHSHPHRLSSTTLYTSVPGIIASTPLTPTVVANPTCQSLWTSTPTESIIESSPTIAGGVIYIGSVDAHLYAFNASGCSTSPCSPIWTSPALGESIESSPIIANATLYVASLDHKLYTFHLP